MHCLIVTSMGWDGIHTLIFCYIFPGGGGDFDLLNDLLFHSTFPMPTLWFFFKLKYEIKFQRYPLIMSAITLLGRSTLLKTFIIIPAISIQTAFSYRFILISVSDTKFQYILSLRFFMTFSIFRDLINLVCPERFSRVLLPMI